MNEFKILIIGVIKNGDSVLMRKKFTGTGLYNETWYSFGTEFIPKNSKVFENYIKEYISLDISFVKSLSWGSEFKKDQDGEFKQFIYLNTEFKYEAGNIIVPEDLEKVEWVPIKNLSKLDIVPPSINLFKSLGYLSL